MKHLALAFAALATAGGASAQTTILLDTMAGASRTDTPTSTGAQWFSGAGTAAGGSGGTALTVTNGTASANFLGYFTPSGSPVALAVGETMTATFSFSLNGIGTATGTTALRIGVFNSGGSRVGADTFGTNAAFTGNYQGYAAMMRVNGTGTVTTTANNLGIYEHATLTTNLLGATADYSLLSHVASQALAGGTNYTGTLTAARTGSGVTVGVTIAGGTLSGYSVSFADTTPQTTSFDTIGFLWAGNALSAPGTFTVNSLEVTVVPEPAATAAMIGVAAFGLVALRRRRSVGR